MRQIIVLLFCINIIVIHGNQVNGDSLNLMPESTSFQTDDEELAHLKSKNMAFSDFCLSSRNYVMSELKEGSTNLPNQLVVYGQGMSPGSKAVLERASLKLFGQLEDPKAPISELFKNYPYDSIIADGMEKIRQTKSYSDSYMIALSFIWQAYSSYSKDELATRLKEAKSMEDMEEVYEDNKNGRTNIANYISEIKEEFEKLKSELEYKHPSVVQAELNVSKQACFKFSEYQNEIRKLFDKMKAKVVSIDESMVGVSLDNVGCLTSKRVLNAVTVCNFIDTAKQPIMRILKEELQQ